MQWKKVGGLIMRDGKKYKDSSFHVFMKRNKPEESNVNNNKFLIKQNKK